jgi:hypothetical protein
MRNLLLGAVLLIAASSPGIADDAGNNAADPGVAVTDSADGSQDGDVSRNGGAWQGEGGSRQHHHRHGSQNGGSSQSSATCAQGFQTATCGDFTGCALPTWQCCPNSSNGGWQWADNSSACPI